jgi:ribosomal protein S6--L-glutamate ligase
MAVKAAKALGLKVAGVDMLQSARGPLIMEVNSSPGLEGVERVTGIDVAGHIIDYIAAHHRQSKAKSKDKIGA